ncbi:P-loop NTPase [Halovenus sp. WSH3]|uniref:P-loop NTPase n=1 Tax=Halovenus carboxidivorans TaxID=2692199 RepID=A0A6B0T5V0_9EURY|nr:P-loop NTPase [Halovenus carboxidivorans]MXR50601.1 P-loop NTPase [Halovenus carboxidivorans]
MAGYVCTVAGGKGGVGKTTTAINIAAALEENGYDTVVVDADLGMANLGNMLGLEYETSIHEVLASEETVSAALTDAQMGMTVVPGEQSLEAFAEADPAKLRKVINTLKNTFDVVLVDTGAGLSHETTVPLGLADGVLLVTTPDDVAVNDTIKTADLTERVDGEVIGAIITRVNRDTYVQEIADEFDVPLLGVIPDDIDATKEEPLLENAPDSDPADAYRQLAGSLEQVFFEGATAADLERVFDSQWFLDDEDEDEEEEDGGVFGGIFG